MKDIKVKLGLARSTKGTHLYATGDLDAAVTSVYVKKFGMPETPPQVIFVTVSIEEGGK